VPSRALYGDWGRCVRGLTRVMATERCDTSRDRYRGHLDGQWTMFYVFIRNIFHFNKLIVSKISNANVYFSKTRSSGTFVSILQKKFYQRFRNLHGVIWLVRANVHHMIVQCADKTNHKCYPF
jgi:hypothetical protein